jgi:DNA helicase-2/ATP-dependent DNA helicase PcrA
MEEGIFPVGSSLEDNELIEEERRLFYVASTRAENALYISAAKIRGLYGEMSYHPQSRFLSELDPETVFRLDENFAFSIDTPAKQTFSSNKRSLSNIDEIVQNDKFSIGMRVKHPDFGTGIIKKIDGHGDSAKLLIVFEGNIRKKLMVQYASLTII